MSDYGMMARKLCGHSHGYGEAIDPTCGCCACLVDAFRQVASEALVAAAEVIGDARLDLPDDPDQSWLAGFNTAKECAAVILRQRALGVGGVAGRKE